MKCVAHEIDYCTTCNTPPPLRSPLPLRPFTAALEGWTANPDSPEEWANSVRVETVESYQDDLTCGDCMEGRCHWGVEESATSAAAGHDYVSPSGPCGCERHEASVRARGHQGTEYADSHCARQLVEIDTNYKSTRDGQHPVRLTRADAVRLAAHLLSATEDTFHYSRVGRLRAVEAAELLRALAEVTHALDELRGHALDDLLQDTAVAGEE